MKLRHAIAACAMAASGLVHAGQISFVFNYTDAAGYGFNDAVYGAERRATMEAAGTYWSNLLIAGYAGETIRVNVYSDPAATSSSPGVNQRPLTNYVFGGTRYGAPLAEYLQGKNLNGSSADAELIYNFTPVIASDTYNGLDGHPGADQFDLLTYNKRYIGRLLGFQTFMDYGLNAADGVPQGGYFTAPSALDRLVGTQLLDGTYVFLTSLTAAERVAALKSGNLYWMGANTLAANDGEYLKLYSALNADGSINGSTATYASVAEGVFFSFGLPKGTVRNVDAVAVGQLRDLGWNVAEIPEPATWSILLAGCGLIGFMRRRRA